jgi:hypothetical protein
MLLGNVDGGASDLGQEEEPWAPWCLFAWIHLPGIRKTCGQLFHTSLSEITAGLKASGAFPICMACSCSFFATGKEKYRCSRGFEHTLAESFIGTRPLLPCLTSTPCLLPLR